MTPSTERDTLLLVPYFSQYLAIENPEYRYNGCGMTCAHMVLHYFGTHTSLDTLIEDGMKSEGYTPSGWVHDYTVSMFRSYGYECERREKMADEDVAHIRAALESGDPVIVSVSLALFDRKFFHQVVLTGFRTTTEGALAGFFYHDPKSLRPEEATNLYVPLSFFYESWRRMAIFPKRK